MNVLSAEEREFLVSRVMTYAYELGKGKPQYWEESLVVARRRASREIWIGETDVMRDLDARIEAKYHSRDRILNDAKVEEAVLVAMRTDFERSMHLAKMELHVVHVAEFLHSLVRFHISVSGAVAFSISELAPILIREVLAKPSDARIDASLDENRQYQTRKLVEIHAEIGRLVDIKKVIHQKAEAARRFVESVQSPSR